MAAQSSDAASSGAPQPPVSAQPQADQPAQDPVKPQPAQPATPHATRRRASLDDRVKTFATSLNLDAAQQAAVKRILVERQAQILRLRTDSSLSGSERIDRLHLLQDQTVEKIRSVLNEEQRKKYNPLAVRQVPPPSDGKTVEDWLKVTTPH